MAGDGMVIFTWNLHKNKLCLELACKHLAHLAANESCVAAFQEAPQELDDAFVGKHGGGCLQLLTKSQSNARGRSVAPKVHILVSSDLEVDPAIQRHEYEPSIDKNRRMEGVGLRRRDGKWHGLHVMGVHGESRINYRTEGERQQWAQQMRRILQNFWQAGPIVVFGDFNANPYDAEMTARTGLLAIRKKDGLNRRRTGIHSIHPVHALYNPMWQILPDRAARYGLGTNVYSHRDEGTYWRCYDQILVSRDLRPSFEDLTVHEQICSQPLVDSKRRPWRSTINNKVHYTYSDHLPVQARLAMERRK